MAAVYILYSNQPNRFYTGSCLNLSVRLVEHQDKKFKDSFTAKVDDWELFLTIDDLKYQQARLIETHIKRMKSKVYIMNLKRYPEMVQKPIIRFSSL